MGRRAAGLLGGAAGKACGQLRAGRSARAAEPGSEAGIASVVRAGVASSPLGLGTKKEARFGIGLFFQVPRLGGRRPEGLTHADVEAMKEQTSRLFLELVIELPEPS